VATVPKFVTLSAFLGFVGRSSVSSTWVAVGDLQIPRPIGEDPGDEIGPVHLSPVKIWAGGLGAA
jgi:hypothetical protein